MNERRCKLKNDSLLKTKTATTKITAIATRHKGTESCGLSENRENKMAEKARPPPHGSLCSRPLGPCTRTRWGEAPVASAFPLLCQFAQSWHCPSSGPELSMSLLVFSWLDPVGIGAGVLSRCCTGGKENGLAGHQNLQP